MIYFYRSLIIPLLLLFAFYTAKASMHADTTNKQIRPLKDKTYDINDFGHNVLQGIYLIQHDSVETGLKLLTKGFAQGTQEKKLDRVMPYAGLELMYLAKQLTDNTQLSETEKRFGRQLFKVIFTTSSGSVYKNPNIDFKALPQTAFAKRLKLFVDAIEYNKYASSELKERLKDDATSASLNILQADRLYDESKYEKAIEYCTKTMALFPQYAYAYELRGKCYNDLDQSQKAFDDFDKAIGLFPQYLIAIYDRADVLMDLDKEREAIYDYQKVFKVNQEYRWGAYNLARAYKNIDMLDSALYYIELHIARNQDDGDGFDIKGDIYYAREDYTTAIAQYSQAITLKPGKGSFYEDRGDAYLASDLEDKAIVDYNKAIQIDNKRAYPYEKLGDCYYGEKDYKKALTYYQKSVQLSPSYKYAFVSISLCYNKLQNYLPAIEAAKKAIAIDSTFDHALGNLGWTYYCNGNYDECIKYSYKALKYNEKAVYAMFNIALATLRKGDLEKSKQLYAFFVEKCKTNNYKINDGVKTDLQDLIKKHIYEKEAQLIIDQYLVEH